MDALLDNLSNEELVLAARAAESAERYEDMAQAISRVVKSNKELTMEERNLLSVAYKNIVGANRSAWRVISSLEINKVKIPERLQSGYKALIEAELNRNCKPVIDMIQQHLIPNSKSPEDKVFYLKMRADYIRYMAEVASAAEREDCVKRARETYEEAFTLAKKELDPVSPIYLGLILNYSVFYYEIEKLPEQARTLAKNAFDEAMQLLNESSSNPECSDSALILQLLRDNLKIWAENTPDEANNDPPEVI